MKKAIGTILFVLWVLLLCLLGAEPSPEDTNPNQWVGITYLVLLFGLPIVWSNLLQDK